MKNKKLKIIIDVLLFLLLILSICSWESNLIVHIVGGIAFTFLLTVHTFLNRKWLVSASKTFKAGKLHKKVKWKFIIDLLLIVAWSIVTLSGFPAIGFTLAENERLLVFSQIHGVSSRLGCVLIIAHIFQHRKQINSYIKRKSG